MTPQARMARVGWIAVLAICTALYLVLHFNVHSISSDVIKAERQIVQLEEQNMLLETEFLTRSSQMQLASWNRVDFGYSAPQAAQFIENERQLAQFGLARAEGAPDPIRLARNASQDSASPFPELVSPITGAPIDVALVTQAGPRGGNGGQNTNIVAAIAQATVRIPLNSSAPAGGGSRASLSAGGAGQ